MSELLPKSVKTLIEEFAKLPGIGPKSAQRLAIYLLRSPETRCKELGEAVLKLKENVAFCQQCWNITDTEFCKVCDDDRRDHSAICVVEEILDVMALEKTGEYRGLYHVLHGALSPIDGVGPDQLKIEDLVNRIGKNSTSENKDKCVKEVVLATNPSLEGEATALYIQKQLTGFDLRITRIARGLPVGADLEYADEITLMRALRGRMEF